MYQDQSDGPYFLMLAYEYTDKKGTHLVTLPKVEFPASRLPYVHVICGSLGNDMHIIVTIEECQIYSASMNDRHGHLHHDIYALYEIIETAVKEMTVEEIEKVLGYKIKIVGKE